MRYVLRDYYFCAVGRSLLYTVFLLSSCLLTDFTDLYSVPVPDYEILHIIAGIKVRSGHTLSCNLLKLLF